MLDSKELPAAAKIMKALAHPLRLGALQALARGEKCVSELHQMLESSQSMMSQQLRILEEQGLIRTRKEGTVKYCSVRNPDFLNLLQCMKKHLKRHFKI